MITLNNVGKVYISKHKQRVEALKDVTLQIGDRGFVFILGKSGSGKSTLLNILGGLDGITSGEISVCGKSFSEFKQSDYDNYRNKYIGFVFQDYNLLHDFDVSGNVALALQLSRKNDISEKVKDALSQVELSDNYLTRKIDELSGGEKQRVAIARSIVKDSPIILADEPTGNLDSATGESIWNIFKKLSETKLVIVVTHDRESAEKYGDRIIEISDGRIVADSAPEIVSGGVNEDGDVTEKNVQETGGISLRDKRKRLSNVACLKMGVNNLFKRKVKTLCVLLLSVFTVFALLLTEVVCAFSSEKTIAEFIVDNDIDYITVTQGRLKNGNEFDGFGVIMKPSTRKYITRNARYIENDVITCKQDILDMGFTFVADALEIDPYSVYLTERGLDNLYDDFNSRIEIDGELERITKRSAPPETLTGKKITFFGSANESFICAGVIDTAKFGKLEYNTFPNMFTVIDYKNDYVYRGLEYINDDEMFPEILIKYGGHEYSKEISAYTDVFDMASMVITEDGLSDPKGMILDDDEIVLSYDMYKYFFGAESERSYISADLKELISIPEHVGKYYPLEFLTYDDRELLVNLGKVKVAGVAFIPPHDPVFDYEPNPYLKFAVSDNTMAKLSDAMSSPTFLLQVSSIKDIKDFLVDFRNDCTGYIFHIGGEPYKDLADDVDYAGSIYGFEHNLYEFKIIFISIGALMSLIFVLFVINLISFSVSSRKKEIGILSALGTTKRDLIKIFIVETLIISIISLILNAIAINVASAIFSNIFTLDVPRYIPLLRVDFFTYLAMFGAAVALPIVATLLPLIKIFKMKPIDAIKNL